jgi:acetyl-CoA carboxylase / biotin carboxylase 1
MEPPASDVSCFATDVAEYVAKLGGKRAIRKVLIANNGIAAVKAIRSIRRWAYETFGNDRAILFIAMCTPQDLGANAEYIRMADEFVEVPGGSNNNNYANVRLIVDIAVTKGADAVWAGWGHASENPALPESLRQASGPAGRSIAFIGPPAKPMHALGDKIGSTIIAQSAGVPCIAWNGSHLRVNYGRDGLPPEVYAQADVRTVEAAEEAAASLGFPLMIKVGAGISPSV